MLRSSYIDALSSLSSQFRQSNDPMPGSDSRKEPVKRKISEKLSVVIKQEPDVLPPPLKARKIEDSRVSCKRPVSAAKVTDEVNKKPVDPPDPHPVSSVQSLKRKPQSDLTIVLSKGNNPPPLVLARIIGSDEGMLRSPKLGRAEAARQSKFHCQVLGQGVYTAQSTRPGAGAGLYAGMDFACHVLITECVGEIVEVHAGSKGSSLTWEKIGSSYDSWSHLVEISDHKILQCTKEAVPGLGGGSFANDSFPGKPNAEFVRIKDEERGEYRVFIKSLCFIPAGAEITVSYGEGFWLSFKEMYPDRYEHIFGEKLFDIDGWNECWQNAFQPGKKPGTVVFRKQGLVDLLNRKKEVPQWEELNDCHKKWNTDLVIYALYKYWKVGPEKLTPSVLSLLKPDSDHYFTAMGKYTACQTRKAKDIISDWGRPKGNHHHAPLMIPTNGVFRTKITTWGSEHINVFYRFFKPQRYVEQVDAKKSSDALMHVLKILNSQHPLYEQLITEYIFRYLKTGIGQTVNFNSDQTKKGLKSLNTLLLSSAPPVPETVCGEPLGSSNKWSTPSVRELLRRKGVQIIEAKGVQYMSPFKQLDMLFDLNEEHEEQYMEGLLSLCRERRCQFGTIARDAKGSRSGYGIRFRAIHGVKYDPKYADKHALFFQYIHHAGIDCQEVYQQATSETLYKCIRMIGPRYKGAVSQRELLAIALSRFGPRNEENRKVLEVAIKKIRDSLHDDLRSMKNSDLCSTLQPLGRKLCLKYEQLPEVAALRDS